MEENREKSKRIAKNTIVLYFRMLFLMAVSLYTSRVVLEALGVDDYGIYNVVGGFVSMFALVSSALTGACTRFLNYEMGKGPNNNLNAVFSSSVTIQYILAIIVLILCETFGLWYINRIMVIPNNRLIASNWCFQFSILCFCINLITVPYNAAIVAHEKMKAFAYVSIFEGIGKLIICFAIMAMSYDRLIFYGLLLMCVQLIVQFMYVGYCRIKFDECKYQFVYDPVLLRKIFSYSGWHIIGNSANILKTQGVNLILNLFFGPVVNAAKGISNQVLHAVQGFAGNFMMALNPQITQSYAKGDYVYMFQLVNRGALYSFYMLSLISLPIIINGEYLLHLWLKEVPDYSIIFSQLTLVLSLVTSLSTPLITAQNATGNVRNYQIIVGGIQLCNLPLCFILLQIGASPVSVMIVAIFMEIITLFIRLYMLPKYIPDFRPFDFVRYVLLKCCLVIAVSLIVPITLNLYLSHNFVSLVINVLTCLICSIACIYYIGFNKAEQTIMKRQLEKIVEYINKKNENIS